MAGTSSGTSTQFVDVPGTIVKESPVAIISSFLEDEVHKKRDWWLISRYEENLTIKKIKDCDAVDIPGLSTLYLRNGLLYCLGGRINKKPSNQVVSYNAKLKDWKVEDFKLQGNRSDHISISASNHRDICVWGGVGDGSSCSERISYNEKKGFEFKEPMNNLVGNIVSFAFNAKSKTIYIWASDRDHCKQYMIETGLSEPLPDILASKNPISVQSLVYAGTLLICVLGDNFLHAYSFDTNKWIKISKLRTLPRTEERVHLVRSGPNQMCVIYECESRKINCYQFEIRKKTELVDGKIEYDVKPVAAGIAFDILPDSAKLSTVASMWLPDASGGKKRKMMEIEFVEDNPTTKKYVMKPREDPFDIARHVSFVEGNISHYVPNYGYQLQCLIPGYGGRLSILEGYSISLRDILNSGKHILWFYFQCQTSRGSPKYYEMVPKLNRILKCLVKMFVLYIKNGYSIKEVDLLDNIVFLENDKNLERPKLMECRILGQGKDKCTGFKCVADLIINLMEPGRRHTDLSPSMRSFLRCLKQETSDDAWITKQIHDKKWEYLVLHPIFLDYEQKLTCLTSIRDDQRGAFRHMSFRVQLHELQPDGGPCNNWFRWLQNSGSKLLVDQTTMIIINKWYGYPQTNNPYQFTRCLRDIFIHGNDGVKDESNIHSRDDFGRMIDPICPGLLSTYFEKHGTLQHPVLD